MIELLREDWRANSPRAVIRPGYHTLAAYRIGRAIGDHRGPARLPLRLVRGSLAFLTQGLYGIELPWQATVGRRLVIGHHMGIVIGGGVVIGDDCLLRQNVTIGSIGDGTGSPRIGHGVQIGAGAVIVGDIVVGDGAMIGPNSVVTTDVPPGARVVAAPSRILVEPREVPERLLPKRDGSTPADSPDAEDVAGLIRDALMLTTTVEADTPLVSSGLVDSLNLVVLLESLESEYAVVVQTEDVSAEGFDTPRQIADYVRSRRS